MSIQKEKYVNRKDIRLPEKIHSFLVAEAQRTGITQPAVVARLLVMERLNQGNLELLARQTKEYQETFSLSGSQKMMLRLSDSDMKIIETAAKVVSGGNFSGLIQAVLLEKYIETPTGTTQLKSDKNTITSNHVIRLSDALYAPLVAEAAKKAIKPSTLARMVLIEQLSNDKLDSFATANKRIKFHASSDAPRILIHLSAENRGLIKKVTKQITSGNLSRLLQLFLVDRYNIELSAKSGVQDVFETGMKSITHNCPQCGSKRKVAISSGTTDRITTCRNCQSKYLLRRDKTTELTLTHK